ncbi:MAG TPA: hypothetical protein PKX87_07950 [Alphaproteobacteria bacterium]|nr:hypothetical protein [Alphaproteobacteria bacterium]
MSYQKAAAGLLCLASVFNTGAAQAATKTVNLAWNASTGGTVCYYEVWSQRLPGQLGGTGTVKKPTQGPVLSAAVTVDDAYTTQFAVRAVGAPPAGKTCADTASLSVSGLSNTVQYGGSGASVIQAFKSLNPYDGDGDGLPDNMESAGGPDLINGKVYYHTYTNPTKKETTTGCTGATDMQIYNAAESIRPYSWLNTTNPYSNGLNNPNSTIFKTACSIVRSSGTPAP